ncbi:hypothetical protein AVEN_211770-1 [Araneus ventricosus]|uniref:Uncharacterized protein n=1 Tax=Araneus ventricosus TaxID=182803 RepID=A0A4Y2UCM4_ARAVE|nr:hypothetical protein AVEN_211770-1 [Araneus ventricosus]
MIRMALISIVYRLSNRRVVSSRLEKPNQRRSLSPRRLLLFSAASFFDVTRDGSAIYRCSAAAGGPHYYESGISCGSCYAILGVLSFLRISNPSPRFIFGE